MRYYVTQIMTINWTSKHIEILTYSQRTGDWIYHAMHTFNILSEDQNQAWVLGLSINLFWILKNIPTVVGITYMENGRECIIYERLILIDLLISTIFSGKRTVRLKWSSGFLFKYLPYFNLGFVHDLVGILINTTSPPSKI